MADKIQLRRDTKQKWIDINPILSAGEPGLETDTGKIKYGNGTDRWLDLDYFNGDDNYKGWFATENNLTTAYPSGQDGWTATVGTTDTIWTWDSDTSAWVDTGSGYLGYANEVHNADEKTTPVDDDEIGIADSEDNYKLKKTKISSINSGGGASSFLDLTDTPSDYTGNAGKVTVVKSTEDGLEFGDVTGGHEIQNDSVVMTDRAALNFRGLKITDNAANDSTDVEAQLDELTDVDVTGRQDGDIPQYNATSGRVEFTSTIPFEDILRSSEANISSDKKLSTIIPHGYRIDTIIIKETSGNNSGNISIGNVSSGSQIVNAKTINANADVRADIVEGYFSSINDTDLYISSSSWGSGVVTVYFTFIKTI